MIRLRAAAVLLCLSASATSAGAQPGRGAAPTTWLWTSPARSDVSSAGEFALSVKTRVENRVKDERGIRVVPHEPHTVLGADRPALAQVTGGDDVRVNVPGDGDQLPNCNTQNEVSLARAGDRIVAGWNDAGECDYLVNRTGNSLSGFGWSHDGGSTWHDGGTLRPEPGGNLWGDPVLAADADGTFFYATLADDSSGRSIIGLAASSDGGRTWSAPVDASRGRGYHAFQDKPWMSVDTTTSPWRGQVYVAWTEFAPEGQRILFARSRDAGRSFSPALQLADEFAPVGTGAQVAVGPDGEVFVVWLTTNERALWFARSLDGGKSFSPARQVASVQAIGHPQDCGGYERHVLDGDIRVKEWPSLAVDVSSSSRRGQVYLAVPSRGAGSDEADVVLFTSPDRGDTWTEAVRINDDATSNDNFHPQLAVGEHGEVVATWYDRRLSGDALRANWHIDLFAAVSRDGGASFAPNVRITDTSFPPSRTRPNTNLVAECYMGEYNGLVAGTSGTFLAAWGDNRDGWPELPDPNVYFDAFESSP